MEETDIIIIGCGVIGLAIAAEVTQPGRSVLILERNGSFGEETSSRNSEVIHAGIYYPKDSWKARACVEGRRLIYALSESYGIPTKRLGKVIVAQNEEEEKVLSNLLERGRANGVDDLELISQKQLRRLEPFVKGTAALHSPSTGIIDSHRLMQYFLGQAQSQGADVVFYSPVRALDKEAKGYRVTVGLNEESSFSLLTRVVVNAAGFMADQIAEKVGINVDEAGYRIKYCKGEYFRLQGIAKRWVKHLVYPVPNEVSLGIHITPDMEGNLRLGPSACYVKASQFSYDIDVSLREVFSNDIKRLLPTIPADRLVPDTAGIRAKLQGPGEPFADFVIQEERAMGFPGFINVLGIDSPGLTSSPAIAKHVAGLVDKSL